MSNVIFKNVNGEIKNMISVVIPFYNTEKYLEECLDSIVNQTISDVEIICVDDGSTDRSVGIVQQYMSLDSRVKLIRKEKENAGAARNAGMDAASGEFIIFLDSDDFFELDLLKKACEMLQRDNSDYCIVGVDVFDQENREFREGFPIILKPFGTDRPISLVKYRDKADLINRGVPWDRLYRTEFIRNNNLRFQSIIRCNDTFFAESACMVANTVSVVEDILLHHRIRQGDNLLAGITSTPIINTQVALYTFDEIIKRKLEPTAVFCVLNSTLIRITKNADRLKKEGRLEILQDYLNQELNPESVFIKYLYNEIEKYSLKGENNLENTVLFYRRIREFIRSGAIDYINNQIHENIRGKVKYMKDIILEMYIVLFREIDLDNSKKHIGIYGVGKHTEKLLGFYEKCLGDIKADIVFIDSNESGIAYGRKLIRIQDACRYKLDSIIISSLRYREEFISNIKAMGCDKVKITDFYDERSYIDLFSWIDYDEFFNSRVVVQ